MTAHALPGDREKCLAAGMDDYVIKPVGLAALGKALERWLPSNGEGAQRLAVETNAASPEAEAPVFDRADLLHRVLNDEDLARQVIEGFLGDLPGQILQLKNSAASGDAGRVEQQSHKIRGASATVGGAALSALAATLEQAAKTGNLVMISTRLSELDAQFEALKTAMNLETSA
jgi:HPt (histidine-containing phosphotransfer) domain-containing protein